MKKTKQDTKDVINEKCGRGFAGEGFEGMPCPADDCPSHEGHRHNAGPGGGEGSEDIIFDDRYWDCECELHFIHRKGDRLECPLCGAKEEDGQPDSRVSELNDLFNHFRKNQLLKEGEKR